MKILRNEKLTINEKIFIKSLTDDVLTLIYSGYKICVAREPLIRASHKVALFNPKRFRPFDIIRKDIPFCEKGGSFWETSSHDSDLTKLRYIDPLSEISRPKNISYDRFLTYKYF